MYIPSYFDYHYISNVILKAEVISNSAVFFRQSERLYLCILSHRNTTFGLPKITCVFLSRSAAYSVNRSIVTR